MSLITLLLHLLLLLLDFSLMSPLSSHKSLKLNSSLKTAKKCFTLDALEFIPLHPFLDYLMLPIITHPCSSIKRRAKRNRHFISICYTKLILISNVQFFFTFEIIYYKVLLKCLFLSAVFGNSKVY